MKSPKTQLDDPRYVLETVLIDFVMEPLPMVSSLTRQQAHKHIDGAYKANGLFCANRRAAKEQATANPNTWVLYDPSGGYDKAGAGHVGDYVARHGLGSGWSTVLDKIACNVIPMRPMHRKYISLLRNGVMKNRSVKRLMYAPSGRRAGAVVAR
jgi:hypothetical protein